MLFLQIEFPSSVMQIAFLSSIIKFIEKCYVCVHQIKEEIIQFSE